MWWGGLRGSVGLALGLSVHHLVYDRKMWGDGSSPSWGVTLRDATLDCRDQPEMVLLLTVVVVVSTVVINGLTMAPLMRMLQLTDVPEERQFMLQRAKKRLAGKTKRAIGEMQTQLGAILPDINWDNFHASHGAALTHCVNAKAVVRDVNKATWLLVVNMERAYYLEEFEKGALGSHAFNVLERFMADMCAEANLAEVGCHDHHYMHTMRAPSHPMAC